MIDPKAFAEWLLAKAEMKGARITADNLDEVRATVDRALAKDGDEIHIACVLRGKKGDVELDERMTRTAVEVLFPKVAMSHPLPGLDLREEKPEPPRAETFETPRTRDDDRRELQRDQRRALFVVFAIMFLICAGFVVSFVIRETRHESPARHEKREGR
jgi:hypothetical protein